MRLLMSMGLLAILTPPALVCAQEHAQELGPRLRQDVAAYEKLTEQLDFAKLPDSRFNYPLVSDNLQRLGERLEELSHLALELEAAAQPDWTRLTNAAQLWENDLRQLRCQSLALRVWRSLGQRGQKKPQWGLAISHAQEPLPREIGSFDADPAETLELTLPPGERRMVQIIAVPLAKPLRGLGARLTAFRGPAGEWPATAAGVLPVDYERLARAESAEPWWTWATSQERAEVPLDRAQAFVLVVTVPAEVAAGEYRGRLRVSAEDVAAVEVEVTLTVTVPDKPPP